eukprot:14011324-Alexandrium_andersonii.AAC.1
MEARSPESKPTPERGAPLKGQASGQRSGKKWRSLIKAGGQQKKTPQCTAMHDFCMPGLQSQVVVGFGTVQQNHR